jgi:hypothetical protein
MSLSDCVMPRIELGKTCFALAATCQFERLGLETLGTVEIAPQLLNYIKIRLGI